MYVTYKLHSLLKSLVGLTVAKTPLPHVVQLASGFRGEVSVEVFPFEVPLGIVSPEEDQAENLVWLL